jgi:hypothetical protein
MEKKVCTPEEINEFKCKMVQWLFDLSVCFCYEPRRLEDGSLSMAMPDDQLKVMVEMIVRLIIANKMTFELEPYSNSIRMIASGDADIYKLNIVSLMKIFREECDRYKRSKTPAKW